MLNDLHGYYLCIYNNGEVTKSYSGYRQVIPKKEKVSETTLWDIASLTKAYTAVLIIIAYEEGKLSIEDKLINYDKNFVNLKDITIKDLLSHNQEIWTDGYIGDAKTYEEYNFNDIEELIQYGLIDENLFSKDAAKVRTLKNLY